MTASNLKIVVLSCNWNGWSCVESATTSGDTFPSLVKVVRLTCLSRIHAGLILKAFEFGADGVMLLGCESGTCHFSSDSSQITREFEKAQSLLEMLGISKARLALVQLPAFAGHEFISKLTEFIDKIESKQILKRVRTTVSKTSSGK